MKPHHHFWLGVLFVLLTEFAAAIVISVITHIDQFSDLPWWVVIPTGLFVMFLFLPICGLLDDFGTPKRDNTEQAKP